MRLLHAANKNTTMPLIKFYFFSVFGNNELEKKKLQNEGIWKFPENRSENNYECQCKQNNNSKTFVHYIN